MNIKDYGYIAVEYNIILHTAPHDNDNWVLPKLWTHKPPPYLALTGGGASFVSYLYNNKLDLSSVQLFKPTKHSNLHTINIQ